MGTKEKMNAAEELRRLTFEVRESDLDLAYSSAYTLCKERACLGKFGVKLSGNTHPNLPARLKANGFGVKLVCTTIHISWEKEV